MRRPRPPRPPGLSRRSRASSVPAWLLVPLVWTLPACGDGPSGTGTTLEVEPDRALLVGVGDTVRLEARAVPPAAGRPPPAPTWRADDRSVVDVTSDGLVRSIAAGATSVVASLAEASGRAAVEVWLPQEIGTPEPGRSYRGRAGYVEYVPGTLPVVLSAPHGGALAPDEIRDRTWGTTVTDRNTVETTEAIRAALVRRTGEAPHVVISHLRRTKLDPNREIVEAAQGDPYAQQARREFQGFIETARDAAVAAHGGGLYFDVHGHGHPIAWVELGYLLSAGELAFEDAALDAGGFAEASSIRALADGSALPFSAVLRGPSSFGALLEAHGYRAVPAPGDPAPRSAPYFSGGYNTWRHGSREEGERVSGIQVELPFPGIRESEATRAAFAEAFADAVVRYLETHLGWEAGG